MKKALKLLLAALLTIVLCASTLTACNTVEENDGDSKNEKASENTVEVALGTDKFVGSFQKTFLI